MQRPPQQQQQIACVLCNSDDHAPLSCRCSICGGPVHFECLKKRKYIGARDSAVLGEFHCEPCANGPFPFWTCWIPLGPVRAEDGRLVVLPKSHLEYQGYHNQQLKKTILPTELSSLGALAKERWRAADVGPGDLILFNIKLIHAASANYTDKFRLSIDTRVTACVHDRE
jgi:ectoine hydroxylase-related dioxygenase (phytanoyl-CoA dioxygenase family)